MRTIEYLKEFLFYPVRLLNTVRFRIGFVAGLCLFLNVFLWLFSPFSISNWIGHVSPFKHFIFPALSLIGGIAALFSHLLQAWILKGKEVRVYHLIAGFVLDVTLITGLLNGLYITPGTRYWEVLPGTFRMVVLVIALGYFVGIILLLLIDLLLEKRRPPISVGAKSLLPERASLERLNILDENGQLRLSLKPADLLYIESADNYVLVCFRKEQRIAKEMVRNSMKRIETDLKESNCVRCHRSYLINLDAVSYLRKEGRSYEALIESAGISIPISRVYMKIISDLLNV